MAFNSTLRIDDSDGFQQVAADVNERLDGDLVLTADKLVRTLPFDPDIWPIYIDLLNDVGDPEPDLYVEQAVCYGLAYTCEDWRHDGQLADSVDNESTTDMLALLRRGMETVDDPDLTAPLNRAIGDFVMAWVNGTILPGVPWSAVQEEATHRRLTGADKLFDGEQSVEAQLEETAESLTGVIKQHTADLDYLHDYSVLYPLENIASITPRVVRPHINLIQNILSELPVDGNKNGMYVLARCSRIVGYVGEVFPEITERTAPMVIEFLRDVVKEEQDDLLGDALAGAVISAKRRPELLEPFGGQLSNWCTDPPGADEMRMEVPTDKIQYYAIYGLYMISDEATDKILTEVTTDSDTPQRVRELAKYILHDG